MTQMNKVRMLLAGLALLGSAPAAAEGDGRRSAYVFFSSGGSGSAIMSGNTDDYREAQALRSGQEPLLFVRQDGAAYIIRDAATLRRGEQIFAPQRALGARQGALGARQGELGRRQAALGAEQARLGGRMADDPHRARALGRQRAALGRQQAALGAQQSELGEQQSALGREQTRVAIQARAELRLLVNEAIRRGVAQRVD